MRLLSHPSSSLVGHLNHWLTSRPQLPLSSLFPALISFPLHTRLLRVISTTGSHSIRISFPSFSSFYIGFLSAFTHILVSFFHSCHLFTITSHITPYSFFIIFSSSLVSFQQHPPLFLPLISSQCSHPYQCLPLTYVSCDPILFSSSFVSSHLTVPRFLPLPQHASIVTSPAHQRD